MRNEPLSKKYLSIGEFAELAEISEATLRRYHGSGVFLPAKLGDGQEHKYCYYSPTQVTTVKLIRILTEIGVPPDTIKELNPNRNPEIMLKLLSKHKNLVADRLRFLQEVHSVITVFSDLLDEGIRATETDVTIIELPEKNIILGDKTEFQSDESFYREFLRFYAGPHVPKLNLSYPIGGYFESMDAFLDEPSRPTRFYSLDPKGRQVKEAGLYLTGYTRGYYGQTNDLPERLTEFARKNGLVLADVR